MIYSKLKSNNVEAWLWTPVQEVESKALDQIKITAALPWAFHHIAIMPDCHWGNGATVGSVIAMKGAITPAAVGVDIGCGMAAIKTNLVASDLPDNLKELRHVIEHQVPVGFNSRDETDKSAMKSDLWSRFKDVNTKVHKLESKAKHQCGTLGGGNHFIEVSLDTAQNVWIVLHSGSRNIGKELAEIHIKKAKELTHNQSLPDRDLAVFLSGTPEFKEYIHDLKWAQEFAALNRHTMMNVITNIMRKYFEAKNFSVQELIQCHHNYCSEETHFGEDVIITRKGAIAAEVGKMGIIPGSMGTKSYIVRGLGNPDSFNSASHGAGRKMSRGAAKKAFTKADLEEQTAGVECRKDQGVVDEIPGAYKKIEDVMFNQSDLVEVVAELKQVMCIKG